MDGLEAFLATAWTPPPMGDEPIDVLGDMRAMVQRMRDDPPPLQPTQPLLAHPVTGWPFEDLIQAVAGGRENSP